MIRRIKKSIDIDKVILDRASNDLCPMTGNSLKRETVGFVDYYCKGISYPIKVPARFVHF